MRQPLVSADRDGQDIGVSAFSLILSWPCPRVRGAGGRALIRLSVNTWWAGRLLMSGLEGPGSLALRKDVQD